jgi:hypothetical protein
MHFYINILSIIILIFTVSPSEGKELQEIEEILFAFKKKVRAEELLVKIKLLEKWSEKSEEKILIYSDGDFG